ncbi:hypothetical protein JTE90_007349 [Oedothorax gibbosus]|uniref:Uncharacterized protein n=1 Tax=Oedothorax gibbosus TaxID=931172 RepID=A0AAV6TT30_9ARAC|nr:hypothetical protein JTE90_007349 [Oedothorax gibbosus]
MNSKPHFKKSWLTTFHDNSKSECLDTRKCLKEVKENEADKEDRISMRKETTSKKKKFSPKNVKSLKLGFKKQKNQMRDNMNNKSHFKKSWLTTFRGNSDGKCLATTRWTKDMKQNEPDKEDRISLRKESTSKRRKPSSKNITLQKKRLQLSSKKQKSQTSTKTRQNNKVQKSLLSPPLKHLGKNNNFNKEKSENKNSSQISSNVGESTVQFMEVSSVNTSFDDVDTSFEVCEDKDRLKNTEQHTEHYYTEPNIFNDFEDQWSNSDTRAAFQIKKRVVKTYSKFSPYLILRSQNILDSNPDALESNISSDKVVNHVVPQIDQVLKTYSRICSSPFIPRETNESQNSPEHSNEEVEEVTAISNQASKFCLKSKITVSPENIDHKIKSLSTALSSNILKMKTREKMLSKRFPKGKLNAISASKTTPIGVKSVNDLKTNTPKSKKMNTQRNTKVLPMLKKENETYSPDFTASTNDKERRGYSQTKPCEVPSIFAAKAVVPLFKPTDVSNKNVFIPKKPFSKRSKLLFVNVEDKAKLGVSTSVDTNTDVVKVYSKNYPNAVSQIILASNPDALESNISSEKKVIYVPQMKHVWKPSKIQKRQTFLKTRHQHNKVQKRMLSPLFNPTEQNNDFNKEKSQNKNSSRISSKVPESTVQRLKNTEQHTEHYYTEPNIFNDFEDQWSNSDTRTAFQINKRVVKTYSKFSPYLILRSQNILDSNPDALESNISSDKVVNHVVPQIDQVLKTYSRICSSPFIPRETNESQNSPEHSNEEVEEVTAISNQASKFCLKSKITVSPENIDHKIKSLSTALSSNILKMKTREKMLSKRFPKGKLNAISASKTTPIGVKSVNDLKTNTPKSKKMNTQRNTKVLPMLKKENETYSPDFKASTNDKERRGYSQTKPCEVPSIFAAKAVVPLFKPTDVSNKNVFIPKKPFSKRSKLLFVNVEDKAKLASNPDALESNISSEKKVIYVPQMKHVWKPSKIQKRQTFLKTRHQHNKVQKGMLSPLFNPTEQNNDFNKEKSQNKNSSHISSEVAESTVQFMEVSNVNTSFIDVDTSFDVCEDKDRLKNTEQHTEHYYTEPNIFNDFEDQWSNSDTRAAFQTKKRVVKTYSKVTPYLILRTVSYLISSEDKTKPYTSTSVDINSDVVKVYSKDCPNASQNILDSNPDALESNISSDKVVNQVVPQIDQVSKTYSRICSSPLIPRETNKSQNSPEHSNEEVKEVTAISNQASKFCLKSKITVSPENIDNKIKSLSTALSSNILKTKTREKMLSKRFPKWKLNAISASKTTPIGVKYVNYLKTNTPKSKKMNVRKNTKVLPMLKKENKTYSPDFKASTNDKEKSVTNYSGFKSYSKVEQDEEKINEISPMKRHNQRKRKRVSASKPIPYKSKKVSASNLIVDAQQTNPINSSISTFICYRF